MNCDDARFGRALRVLLALVGDPDGPALGWTRAAAAEDPVRFAGDVAAAAVAQHPEAHRAARMLAWLARGPPGDPFGGLGAPAQTPAYTCAAVAFGAFEVLGRVAALDAAASAHPAVARHEDLLAQYMARCRNTPLQSLSQPHTRSLQLLAVPRQAARVCDGLLDTPQQLVKFEFRLPHQPRRMLAAIVGRDGIGSYDVFAVFREGRADGWRGLVRTQLPVAHAALMLVDSERQKFTRTVIRLVGDAAWPVGAPVQYPTLVVLGPRCYVLEGAAVAAYGGPGTAFVAWRRRLRAALGIAHDDSFSDLLGNA